LSAENIPGTAFTKCFYNSSTIIPSSILPQDNPDATNSSKRGKIVEELWKNCRKIFRVLVRLAAGKNPRSILRLDERAPNFFYNFSTVFQQFFPTACRGRARKIFLQFFHNSSLMAVYPSGETKFLQGFWGRIVEECNACQIRGRIFHTAMTRILRGKAGKCARGIIVEKS
jgi:hypothetical protein